MPGWSGIVHAVKLYQYGLYGTIGFLFSFSVLPVDSMALFQVGPYRDN